MKEYLARYVSSHLCYADALLRIRAFWYRIRLYNSVWPCQVILLHSRLVFCVSWPPMLVVV